MGRGAHHVEVLEALVEAHARRQSILHSRADDDAVFVCELFPELGSCSVHHFVRAG